MTEGPAERGRRRTWGVVGGAILGFLLSFAVPVLVSLVVPSPAGLWVGVAIPLVLGVLVLVLPRWRRLGAGFVMGLAVGGIVFAGVCGGFLLSLDASLGPSGL